MASRSNISYSKRADMHESPLVQKLFRIADSKKTNIVVSADLTTTPELLDLADRLGPFIAVFKTHIDIISDFGPATVDGLKMLSAKHNFLVFEDRKFVDIGNTVQMQYHGGALRISEWADIVNASILAGPSIIDAMAAMNEDPGFAKLGPRGCLILAEMTTKGTLAKGEYTKASVDVARRHPHFVIGFVSLSSLSDTESGRVAPGGEDFVVFTTGINQSVDGDSLGQQYNTPRKAIMGGSDFVISGRGIYAAEDPVETAKAYQSEAWDAYLSRIQKPDSGA